MALGWVVLGAETEARRVRMQALAWGDRVDP